MDNYVLPPGMIALLGALLIPLLPKGVVRKAYLLALPLLSFANLIWLQQHVGHGSFGAFELLGNTIEPLRIDSLSLTFGYVFHLALFIGTLFALHVEDPIQHVSAFIYAGGTIAAVFVGDLVSLFVYWEVVAVASTFLIWARRTPRAYRAGMRYLLWQITSGVILLAGILLYIHDGNSVAFGKITLESRASWLIFFAFGIKSAWPLLHTWLTDGYPEATPTGAVFLSAFTSKLAVYALARSFAGTELLIPIGAVMAGFPIFYAVIENDLRRVLAYSLINQVGFMVVGVGIGTELGINGAVAHAFADVLFKGLLFMTMGAVLQQTGKINGSELGGLFKSMPFTCLCCIVGAASISAFPLFSAFATKSMIMSAVAAEHLDWVWYILLFAAAGVFHHAGIKIPFFAFFAHDSGLRPEKPPLNMRIAMGIAALCCILLGSFPHLLLYPLLPYADTAATYHVYTAFHVVGQVQLLFFSALAFVTLMRTGLYPPELPSVNLDADWLARRPLLGLWNILQRRLAALAAWFQQLCLERLPRLAAAFVEGYGPERGAQRELWQLGSSVLIVMILLSAYLLMTQGIVR